MLIAIIGSSSGLASGMPSAGALGLSRNLRRPVARTTYVEASFAVNPAASLKLRKQGQLQTLTCVNQSITGPGTVSCTVTLTYAAPSGGSTVVLSSSNAAVSVPASVAVPAGSSSTSFPAAIAAVSTAQTASITASAGGSTKSYAIQLNASAAALSVGSTSVSFGAVNVGQTATRSVSLSSTGNLPLTISSISVVGSLFSATGLQVPLTLNPGQSVTLTLKFYSDHTSSYTGTVTIVSNSAQGSSTINMSASGVPALSGLTCNTQSYSSAGADSCLVSLYGTAPGSGFTVSLASNNTAVTVPASVTVPPGAMSAAFSASVNAVSTTQTATLSATAGGITKSFGLQLAPANAVLIANASTVPFGSVLINSPAEQSVLLSSSGSSPVTISSISITGGGFTSSGVTTPMTLNPGQTAVLNVQFTPTSAANFTGQITITSNAAAGNLSIGLSGTGYGHKVQLSWNAGSPGITVGYNVYRAMSGSTGYQRMNPSIVGPTTFTDGNAQSGSSYVYYVTSVDGSGMESAPSNTTAVSIPTP